MAVSDKHPEYETSYDVWRFTRDAASGEHAIKAHPKLYLPEFIPVDEKRYRQYLKRAFYMNVTGRTLDSLVGMIFRKPAMVELPEAITPFIENIDGAGQSLEQLSKEATTNLMLAGRHIFLVDYPQVEGSIDAETEARLGLQPVIKPYMAESLINWKTQTFNGQEKLTLAVLVESVSIADDEFEHKSSTQYRVLRLRDGVYTQQVYNYDEEPITAEFAPRMAGGRFFNHIPLHIAGAQNNKPDVDMPPLYDMAIVNVAHYQTTADHRENLFIHGQLTLGVVSDMSAEEFANANPSGVQVGARTGHFLGSNGNFVSVTAPESSSLRVALNDLENQMVMLGARLVQRGGQAETAEASRINASAEASSLDLLVNNLSEALEAALEDMARFVGANPEQVLFTLNTAFWETKLDAQTVAGITGLLDKAVIAKSDARNMVRVGRIEIAEGRTDEEIDTEIAGDFLTEDGLGS